MPGTGGWGIFGWILTTAGLVCLIFGARTYKQNHPSAGTAELAQAVALGNHQELRDWLDKRIDELRAWRLKIDEEATKKDPDFEVLSNAQTWFWEHLHPQVTTRLLRLSIDQAREWEESMDWSSERVPESLEKINKFSRFFGSAAEHLRRVKGQIHVS
jgi:hypothetical protein